LVVGLTPKCLGQHAPRITAFANAGSMRTIRPAFPAVTCSAQAAMLTGQQPSVHGIVGNGWYDRESAEIRFWKQSNHLVRAPKVWEAARQRDRSVTCAKLFWWYNMHSSADIAVTPRPMYPADGRKIPDVYTTPPGLRNELQDALGRFPLFKFWGPMAGIESSQWIAESAKRTDATLSLVYLPHLDYSHQKFSADSPEAIAALREIDAVVGDLIDHYQRRDARVSLVSEYGIEPCAHDAPIHINRALRKAGFVSTREELGRDMLDPGASRVFAVADHQIAHVYVREHANVAAVASLCESIPGVDTVLGTSQKHELGIEHDRAGDLILVAEPGRWFTYYHWLDDAIAPDFARTVDIHRKPGYDPCELFIDPAINTPKLAVASRLLRKKLGMRTLMDVIPLDASLVRGTHGRSTPQTGREPVWISSHSTGTEPIAASDVHDLILEQLFSQSPA
ncbi:MAG: nucleotide pyrophosphatase/phosphodiesterase family protein, partial [Planctomycetota bacterium]